MAADEIAQLSVKAKEELRDRRKVADQVRQRILKREMPGPRRALLAQLKASCNHG